MSKNGDFEVENIIDHIKKGNKDLYLVKWVAYYCKSNIINNQKHYPSSKNTWEPEKHFTSEKA